MTHAQQPVPNYTTKDGLIVSGRQVCEIGTDTAGKKVHVPLGDDDPRAKAARMERDLFAREGRHSRSRAR